MHSANKKSLLNWHEKKKICRRKAEFSSHDDSRCTSDLERGKILLPNPKGLLVAESSWLAFAELADGGAGGPPTPAAAEPLVDAPRDLLQLPGFNSAFKSEKLSDVLINLEMLSKLTEPLIT